MKDIKVNTKIAKIGKIVLFSAIKSRTRPYSPRVYRGGSKSLEAITTIKSLIITRLLLLKGVDPILIIDNN